MHIESQSIGLGRTLLRVSRGYAPQAAMRAGACRRAHAAPLLKTVSVPVRAAGGRCRSIWRVVLAGVLLSLMLSGCGVFCGAVGGSGGGVGGGCATGVRF